jgi:hypothetical protein
MGWLKKCLRNFLLRFLGLSDHEERLKDVERHFVTKRDQQGVPTETLADVPVDKRDKLRGPRQAGLTPHQRRAYLEATDGGMRAPMGERLPSTS